MDLDEARPRFHFTVDSGWINDPVALTVHAGEYHLFYQYVAGSPLWQPEIGWGHASSPDLLTWTEHPAALSPGEGDLGCWSGSLAIGEDGDTVMLYTSINHPDHDLGVVREARPTDHTWRQWRKGPVVAEPPRDIGLTAFRDPSVYRDGALWRMIVGGGYDDGHAGIVGYSSPDLRTWTYDGPVADRAARDVDGVPANRLIWECPHLLRIDGHDLLIASVWADGETQHVEAAVGALNDGRFEAETWTRLTYGGPYAATRFTDDSGHPGLVFWLRSVGDETLGWFGALSIPYLLAIHDGKPRLAPHPVLRTAAAPSWHTMGRATDPYILRLPNGAAVKIRPVDDGVEMTASDHSLVVPGDGAEVLADGLVVEMCTGHAVASIPLSSDPRTQPAGS